MNNVIIVYNLKLFRITRIYELVLHFTQRLVMLDLIRIFIKTVDTGSFSKTGAVLGMAPSSVARNIDNLEKKLNNEMKELGYLK